MTSDKDPSFSTPAARLEQGIHLMAKPVGPVCNLECRYCFFLEKKSLYPTLEVFRMTDEVLEAFVRSYIGAQSTSEVEFTWQGGEPTLMGLDFFRKAVILQRKYANGKTIRNTLQTNGTLLDEAWGEFLAREMFLVGLSLDGPRELNDIHRHDKRKRSSFDQTMRGMELLRRFGVTFNVLVTVSREVSRQPLTVYHFLKDSQISHIQFNPVVERLPMPEEKDMGLHFAKPPSLVAPCAGQDQTLAETSSPVTAESVEQEGYGDFLCAVYDEWVRQDVGRIHVMNFEWALAAWCQLPPSVCLFSPKCGKTAIVEHDGSVYSCDHFMYLEYRLGSLTEDDVSAMMDSARQLAFGSAKENTLPRECQVCTYRFACHGECPKNRFLSTVIGEPGLNYLCPSYLKYFRHITQTMNAMSQLLAHGKSVSLIMDAFKGPLIVSIRPSGSQ
jgi:uncharacterized protein